MALRVLLADESSTIKKVMQLALQDFGVDVKSVPVGLDVLTVTKSYKPDIIFADVLLSKRSGYEVCRDIKMSLETKGTPVVLMWSGFMELDETKAQASFADARLEKPFDADTLRDLVRRFVPKTTSNPVSSFLNFPPMPEFEEPAPANSVSNMSIESLPELEEEEFAQVPLRSKAAEPEPLPNADENWSQQSIQQFKVSTPEAVSQTSSSGDPQIDKFMIPDSELGEASVISEGDFEEVTFQQKPLPKPQAVVPTPTASQRPVSATETVLLERVAREEARALIENICWKILPEITERIVREEISKILKQAEKDI